MKTALRTVALACACAFSVSAHAERVLPKTPSAPTNPAPTPGTYCGAVPVCIIPVKG